MKPIYILGTGSHLPEKVMHNRDLEKIIETTDEWIYTRTGIRERRVARPDEAASDLALPACQQALAQAGMKPEDVEVIIMGTITPDTQCPAGANWLQAKLGASNAITFDVSAACSGFLFALHVAEKYLLSGMYKNVLVTASEIMTRVVDWTDRSSCILWGDGAGAVVLSVEGNDSHPRLLSVHAHTDGANGQNLLMPGGGSKTTPISYESVDKKLHFLRMIEASASVRVAVSHFADACLEAIEANQVSIEEVTWFIPHQANVRIIQSLAKRLHVDMDRFYMIIEKYANMSSASCSVALAEAAETGTLKRGDLVCLTAFGGGLTWGSALIRW